MSRIQASCITLSQASLADKACCSSAGLIATLRTVPPKSRTKMGFPLARSIRVLSGCTGTLLAWLGPASGAKVLGGFPWWVRTISLRRSVTIGVESTVPRRTSYSRPVSVRMPKITITPSSETWTRQAVEPIRLTKTVSRYAPYTLCGLICFRVNPGASVALSRCLEVRSMELSDSSSWHGLTLAVFPQ